MTKILRVFPYPLNDLTITDGTHTITLASGLHYVQQYMVGATPKSVYQFDLEYLENHGYISSGVLTITSTDYAGNTKQVNTSTGSSPYDAMWEDIVTYTGNSGGSGNSGDSGGDDPGSGSGDDPEPEEPEVNDPEGIYIDCLDEISLTADTKTAIKTAIESKGVTVAEGAPFANYAGLIDSIVELKGETQTIIPTTTQQIVTPTLGKNGITEVTVSAVTSTIDPNIIPANIKVGTTILGVEGTNQGGTLQAKTLTVGVGTPTEVVLTPDAGNYGLSSVTVDMDYIEDELDDILGSSVVTDNSTLVYTGIVDGDLATLASTFKFPDNVTTISANLSTSALSGLYGLLGGLSLIDFNNVTTITGSMQYFMQNATGITSILFPEVTSISSNMLYAFKGCTGLTSVIFPKLTTISGSVQQLFANCTNLSSLSFPELTTFSVNNMGGIGFITGCTSLTTLTFPKLVNIPTGALGGFYQLFSGSSLQSLSFPAFTTSSITIQLNNQTNLQSMLTNTTGCTVHFPSNLQSIMSTCDDVINGFGGTDTVVLFDLPATS